MQEITALLIIVLMAAALAAFFLAIRLLFPARVELTRMAAEEMLARSFFLGLVNSIFFSAVILGLLALAENMGVAFLALLALILLVIYGIALAFGLTAMIELTGARLLPQGSANRRSILGSVVLILGCLTPFVGWFGLFVYVGFLGVGAFILGLFRKAVPTVLED